MRQADMGGSRWGKQFVYGLPLAGAPRKRYASPVAPKARAHSEVARNQIFDDVKARFTDRGGESGVGNGSVLLPEAL